MIKLTLFILVSIILSGCVNKHGVSAKYYSDCDEYYDLQGYYHNECGKDDMFTYKEAKEKTKELKDDALHLFTEEKKAPPRNVW